MHTDSKLPERVIEFFFDFGSPTAYLAYKVLPNIAKRHSARIEWRPVLLGGVFKLSNNTTPAMHPLKSRWMMQDLSRWARHWGVAFKPGPIPMSTLPIVRGATALLGTPLFYEYCNAVFDGLWRDGLDFNKPTTLLDIVRAIGWPTYDFEAAISSEVTKQSLTATTHELVERGGFGVPTMFVQNEMYFGQDRLSFVEAALQGAGSAT